MTDELSSEQARQLGPPIEERWALDDSAFPDLLWARLHVHSEGRAVVFDCDGRYWLFPSRREALTWLSQDEYTLLDDLDDEDAAALGVPVGDLRAPSAATDRELVRHMVVRRREP